MSLSKRMHSRSVLFFSCVLFTMISNADEIPESATRFFQMNNGEKLGERIVWKESDNSLRYILRSDVYGIDVKEKLVLDEDGLPSSLAIYSDMYPGVEWQEAFERKDSTYTWRTSSDRGSKTLKSESFYAAVKPAHDLGVLARALLNRADKSIDLVPFGKVFIEQKKQHEFTNRSKEKLNLYALYGLSMTPQYVLLNTNHETVADRWSIREDWIAFTKEIDRLFRDAEAAHLEYLAKKFLPPKREFPLIITNVSVFDSVNKKVIENCIIKVVGEKIEKVYINARPRIPKSAEVIDGGGAMLLPGLWDMHAHLFPIQSSTWLASSPLNLASGVTTIRDLASNIDALSQLRIAISEDKALGPNVIPIGLIDGVGGVNKGDQIFIENKDDLEAALNKFKKLGYTGVKSYNSIPKDLIIDFVKSAKSKGLYVSGHPPYALNLKETIAAGYQELHHLQLALSVFSMSTNQAIEIGESWDTFYQIIAEEFKRNSPSANEFINLLKSNNVALDITLSPFISGVVPQDWIAADIARIKSPLARRLANTLITYEPTSPYVRANWEKTKSNMLSLINALHNENVNISIGTDTFPGFGLYAEMKLFVKAGLSPADVLSLASHGAAKIMKMDSEVGNIAPGQRADLILVEGDPTKNIDDIRNIKFVIKAGRVIDSKALFEELRIEPTI